MSQISNGIQNELKFVNMFNNKTIKDLPQNAQELIYKIFNNVNSNSKITCWKSKYLEKADIKIKINDNIKGVSIKTGYECSMHQENKYQFYNFLNTIGVDKETIEILDNFMNGIYQGKKVNAKTYISYHIDDIKLLKDILNNYYIKNKLLIRFIFQGTEKQSYDCNALIYGTPSEFIWATNDEILEYLLKYKDNNPLYLTVSALNIKCYDRNLKNNPNRTKKEEDIQIKWYTLKEDLLYINKIREAKKIKHLK